MLSLQSVGFALSLGTVIAVASAADQEVSFKKDVMPVLQANCLECHSPGGKHMGKSGLQMDTYEHLMKGSKYGPVINPGDSVNSMLVQVIFEVKKVDPSIRMPHGRVELYGGVELPDHDKNILKAWVDQGAQDN